MLHPETQRQGTRDKVGGALILEHAPRGRSDVDRGLLVSWLQSKVRENLKITARRGLPARVWKADLSTLASTLFAQPFSKVRGVLCVYGVVVVVYNYRRFSVG